MAIEPKSTADREKLAAALLELAERLQFRVLSTDLDHIRIDLMSELHCELVTEEFRKLAIELSFGAPQVNYRETFATPAEVDYTHASQSGPAPQFARIKLRFEPVETYELVFVNGLSRDHGLPAHLLIAAGSGVNAAARSGPIHGYPVIGFRTRLADAVWHDADSTPLAFEIAARCAFRDPVVKAAMVLLEPISRVWVVAPEGCVGSVVGDLNSRRGAIQGQTRKPDVVLVEALVPVANLFGYKQSLHALSQGRATWTWEPAGLAETPTNDDPPFRTAMAMRA